jgi:hypothetical protein
MKSQNPSEEAVLHFEAIKNKEHINAIVKLLIEHGTLTIEQYKALGIPQPKNEKIAPSEEAFLRFKVVKYKEITNIVVRLLLEYGTLTVEQYKALGLEQPIILAQPKIAKIDRSSSDEFALS